jgi:hypothetical protein
MSSSKPPQHPLYPDRSTADLSAKTMELGEQAYEATMTGDHELMQEANAKHSESIKEDHKKGVASGLYTRKSVPNLSKSKGGKTRRSTSTGGDIVTHLLTIRNQVKLYHWQTGSFARHKATDDLTAALDLNIDTFVESYMGRYGRPKVSGSIKLHNFSESAARSFVAKQTTYLSTVLPRKIKKTDTDLLNLRDTILGDLNKVLYLFTLQ